VDFRDLVKQLVGELKMRIELRQISVRDRTAALGGVGACGLMTCCSSFLKNYGNVSIKMAKNQNLALIPSKINGVCGQLKCCIKYEDEVYGAKRKLLPKEGTFLEVKNGDRGKVTKLHILHERFDMITEQGKIRRYAINQYDTDIKLPENWLLPQDLGHITNETSTIIGLEVKESPVDSNYSDEKEEDAPATKSNEKFQYQDSSDKEKENKTDNNKNRNSRNHNRNRNRNRNNKSRSKSPNSNTQNNSQDNPKQNTPSRNKKKP
ncbi:MAG: hypothetical protein HOM21_03855, partial [Halobacteriovoraceae bacterium]|nr:hypothetical protein [Halobacteriovoraceae bacterium]